MERGGEVTRPETAITLPLQGPPGKGKKGAPATSSCKTPNSILHHRNGAVLATLAPGSQTDFLEKRPLALVDAREQVDAGFAAPVAHRLGAIEPADRLEAGDVAVRPLSGVDHVTKAGVENLVLARRLVGQIEPGVGFAAGPPRVIGL